MSPASAALIAAFWSWVAGVAAVLCLGVLLPATLGGLTGLLPLVRRRGDWRTVPQLGLACLSFVVPGAFALLFIREGVPTIDFWLVLAAQIGAIVYMATALLAADLSRKRIRRDQQALDAIQALVPQQRTTVEAQRPLPRARLGAIEAEYYVAEWMRWLGAVESEVTRARRDGGVDVRSAYYVAQVKHRPNDYVSVDVIRALQGVASQEHRDALVFASGRYSSDALGFAARASIVLFIFRPAEGKLVAANSVAQRLYHDGLRTTATQSV